MKRASCTWVALWLIFLWGSGHGAQNDKTIRQFFNINREWKIQLGDHTRDKGRFIRIVFTGQSDKKPASISEIEVFGK